MGFAEAWSKPFKLLPFKLLPFILLLLTCSAHSTEQKVTTWNYYVYPPFILDNKKGLAYEFITRLNEYSLGKYVFTLNNTNRKRIDAKLGSNKSGIVMFVNPRWMGYNAEHDYLWSASLFSERNEIISSSLKRVDFQGPDSLSGLTFGAVTGRQYVGLEALFNEGKITRYDTESEAKLFSLLVAERVDVISLPKSMALQFKLQLTDQSQLYFSPTPLFNYTRHLLVTQDLPEIQLHLNDFLEQLKTDKPWLDTLEDYHLTP